MRKRVLGAVCTACMIIIVFLTSIEAVTFNQSFYDREYKKYGVPESIAVSHYELMGVTERLLGYMRGRYDDLVVTAHIAGEKREFFNQREKDHMVDVKNLFDIGYTIRNIAFIVLLITVLAGFLFQKEERVWLSYARCIQWGIVLFISVLGALVGLVLTDFNRYFNIFHEIFFDNDLWILNPETDLLVNIVPLGFFTDIFKVVAALFFIAIVIIEVLAIYVVRMHRKKPAGR